MITKRRSARTRYFFLSILFHFDRPNIFPHFPSNPSSTKHFPSQKMSTFSLSHLMARVVMITRRRSAIFSMMGHTEQIWEEQIDSSLRRSLDHCVLHQRSHNVEGLGESILRKIQSQGRNLGSLSMNYFGAQKIRGELLPEEFRQK